MAQWLEHWLLLRKTQLCFLTPIWWLTAIQSRTLVTGQVMPSSGCYRHCTHRTLTHKIQISKI